MKFIIFLNLCFLCTIQIKANKADKVVQFAKSKVGCGYVWSAEGQILTEDELDYLYSQYPKNIDKSIVRKWIGQQVYDCSGFVMKAFEKVNIYLNHNAQYAWEETDWLRKGKIKDYPKDKVCILYRYNSDKGKMTHTGIYIGGGLFIHAKGSEDGVVMESMPSTWTHYGLPRGLY